MRELVGNGKTLFLNFMFDLAAQEMKNIEVMKSVTTFLSFVRSFERESNNKSCPRQMPWSCGGRRRLVT